LPRRPAALLIVLAVLVGLAAPTVILAADPSSSPLPTDARSPSAEPAPTPTPTATPPITEPLPTQTPSPTPAAGGAEPTGDTPEPDGSVTLADGTVLPPMPDGALTSVHGEMLAEHADDGLLFEAGGAPVTMPEPPDGSVQGLDAEPMGGITALPSGMQREVLGFLPYWMLTDGNLAEMNYQLVSTIAYFSVGALPDGNLDKGSAGAPSSGWSGWTSAHMTRVIDNAHRAGGKVVLTVTMMAWSSASYDRMRTLLTSAAARGRLVGQIVDAVRSRGADGVNLDFELVPTDMRAQYAAFVRQLKTALRNAGVGSYLTVCTTGGAASWATGYDLTALIASGGADALFVMGYDFHWSGSTRAGAVAPIDSPYVLDVSTAMADFLAQVPAGRIIWGVPYYGRGWDTTSSALNAPTAGNSFALYYTAHVRDATKYGRMWDAVGKGPWYRYYDGARATWVQAYYDDAASLGVKYDLVNRYDLAGTGMWTLFMDGTRDELWRLLASKFVHDTSPPSGGVTVLPQSTRTMAIEVSWQAIDYQSGLDYYNVQVRDRASSTWTSWLNRTRGTRATYIGTPGRTYEFRVQAVDWKGNRQPWITAPGKAASVSRGSFATVIASVLNVRSGPGTTHAILDTLAAGDRVRVIGGPTASGGYEWFQVEYGFEVWPSTDYPRIGWVARAGGGETWLVPAYAPSVTRLDPFLDDYALTSPAFSPNGDGRKDTIGLRYTLPSAVADLRVNVVNTSDRLVRQLALGAQGAGPHVATWDGRDTSGAFAPDGRYLMKVVATLSSGDVVTSPTPRAASNVVARWGLSIDRGAPSVSIVSPASGAEMLPASVRPMVTFNEGMTGLTAANVSLERIGVGIVAATIAWNATTRVMTVTPSAPLATSAGYRLSILAGAADLAGNPIAPWSASFTTAPGTVFAPARSLTVKPGTYTAYGIGAGGDVTAAKTLTFARASGAKVSQRATLPNLPGRWLYVENGAWAGMWLPEAAGTYLAGETERAGVAAGTRLAFAPGSHTGYRFATDGAVSASRTALLAAASGANVSARAIINGAPHWYVTNGIWAGWWVPESARVYRAGSIGQVPLASWPRIAMRAGTYTGYRYDAAGHIIGSKQATLARASGAPASSWAVINGRPHFLVSAGIWSGYWVPADGRMTFAP
jgi:spore germination protein YaaH